MTASGLLRFEKLVYGDIELSHVYDYDADGRLRRAEILMLDEDPTVCISTKMASLRRFDGKA